MEELRSEKNLLLASLAYTEDDVADKFPKDIATMKQSLKRLEEQGQKYSTELDAALNEYAGLREQAQGFNPVQLYETRQAIRPGKEQEAENRAQQVYGEKYNLLLMFDSKKRCPGCWTKMLNGRMCGDWYGWRIRSSRLFKKEKVRRNGNTLFPFF